ncbi:MAG: Fic family protein [Candidatus Endonucleobacter bathymodioli]|uniref:Fic family protein n=1 Tax=Candidatus Endonucleibacter bathymodioli TaxID=539814 RepID=A0AA90NNY9_9GAMM|nr:Fic family protein [Candidatus Endonucleobacter bathymodioli]
MIKKIFILITLLSVCLNATSVLDIEVGIGRELHKATTKMLFEIDDNQRCMKKYTKKCIISYINIIKNITIIDVLEANDNIIYKDMYSETQINKLFEISKECNNIVKNLQKAQLVLDENDLTNKFPAHMLYQLFIDKEDWGFNGGIYTYEDELGYASALLTAWYEMKNILSGGPINFQKIKELHGICTSNVLGHKGQKLLFPRSNVCVGAALNRNCTIKGTTEILLLAKSARLPSIRTYYNKLDTDGQFIPSEFIPELYRQLDANNEINNPSDTVVMLITYHDFTKDEIRQDRINMVEVYCGNYEVNLQKIKNNTDLTEQQKQDKIIEATAEVCRNIQFTHPFLDGNARTIGCILLNGLLMKQNLSPAIIPDVNVFDAYDIETLVEIIKAGQKTFQQHRVLE